MFKKLLKKVLPPRAKRLLVCGSVFAHVSAKMQLDVTDDRLERLNRSLELASEVEGLKLPCIMSEVIWKALPEPPITADKVSDFIDAIIVGMPEYLIYSVNRKDLSRDMENILSLVFRENDNICVVDERTQAA